MVTICSLINGTGVRRQVAQNKIVSTNFIRMIFLPKLSLRIKFLYLKWLVGSICLMRQSQILKHIQTLFLALCFVVEAPEHRNEFWCYNIVRA